MSLQNRFTKVSALLAATLILPALAFAGHDNGKDNDRENYGKRNDPRNKPFPHAPEANAGWVLVPFFGAVLLFSSLQLFRAKAGQNIGR